MGFKTHKELVEMLENEELECKSCHTTSENDLIISDIEESENEDGDVFCHNCQYSFGVKN